MRFLIGTHNALVLWDNDREIVLHEKQGSYYGITWSPDQIFAVARENRPGRLLAYNANMTRAPDPDIQGMDLPGDDGPHQILWWDGILYVTNTQQNAIYTWDGFETLVLRWERVAGDHDHINSVWRDPSNGRLWVAEHRHQNLPKRIRILDPDHNLVDTLELDLPSLADGPAHSGLHNIYVEDGILHTLGPSQLVLHDLASGRTREVQLEGVVKYKHYLRGLARSEDYFFIGVSNARPRDLRGWGASSVLVLSPSYQVLDRFTLSPELGQVMEIRIVDEFDHAHNGITCPLERRKSHER